LTLVPWLTIRCLTGTFRNDLLARRSILGLSLAYGVPKLNIYNGSLGRVR